MRDTRRVNGLSIHPSATRKSGHYSDLYGPRPIAFRTDHNAGRYRSEVYLGQIDHMLTSLTNMSALQMASITFVLVHMIDPHGRP
jgi:hypothetical protein